MIYVDRRLSREEFSNNYKISRTSKGWVKTQDIPDDTKFRVAGLSRG
jgi:hypothetical protein